MSISLVFCSLNKKKSRVVPFLRLDTLSLHLVYMQVTAVIERTKVKYSIQPHLITGQATVCRYQQLMLTEYGVPTSSAWILSNQRRFISRDLSKKVNIDRQSDSSLRRVIQQLILRFLVIVSTSALHKPILLWKPLLGSCYALPLCLWHKDTELIGCLRHHNCAVRW